VREDEEISDLCAATPATSSSVAAASAGLPRLSNTSGQNGKPCRVSDIVVSFGMWFGLRSDALDHAHQVDQPVAFEVALVAKRSSSACVRWRKLLAEAYGARCSGRKRRRYRRVALQARRPEAYRGFRCANPPRPLARAANLLTGSALAPSGGGAAAAPAAGIHSSAAPGRLDKMQAPLADFACMPVEAEAIFRKYGRSSVAGRGSERLNRRSPT
jgi:hypothetical protein